VDRKLLLEVAVNECPAAGLFCTHLMVFDGMFRFAEWLGSDGFDSRYPGDGGAAGSIHFVVPPEISPGSYGGQLEIKGNFPTTTVSFKIVIPNHREQVDKALEALDRSPVMLPLGELMRQAKPGDSRKVLFGDPESKQPFAGVWSRWALCGDMIWDMGTLQTIGPILQTLEGVQQTALRGPKDKPRLYVLRSKSIDIVDVRERKTIQQLTAPGRLYRPLMISADGNRAAAMDGASRLWLWPSLQSEPILACDKACESLVADMDLRHFVGLSGKSVVGIEAGSAAREIALDFEPEKIFGSSEVGDVVYIQGRGSSFKPRLAAIGLHGLNVLGHLSPKMDRVWKLFIDKTGRLVCEDSKENQEVYSPSTQTWENTRGVRPGMPVPGAEYRWDDTPGGIRFDR
jgi:hypothetical protein